MSAGKAFVVIAVIAAAGWVAYNYMRYKEFEKKAQELRQQRTMELNGEIFGVIADAVSGLQQLEYAQ